MGCSGIAPGNYTPGGATYASGGVQASDPCAQGLGAPPPDGISQRSFPDGVEPEKVKKGRLKSELLDNGMSRLDKTGGLRWMASNGRTEEWGSTRRLNWCCKQSIRFGKAALALLFRRVLGGMGGTQLHHNGGVEPRLPTPLLRVESLVLAAKVTHCKPPPQDVALAIVNNLLGGTHHMCCCAEGRTRQQKARCQNECNCHVARCHTLWLDRQSPLVPPRGLTRSKHMEP